ncbi:MAG: hypothetical protein U0790_03280 [Isosphaeraceae bacterium]
MAIAAAVTLGTSALVGWILGQVFRLSAGVLELLADGVASAARTNELIEEHLIPSLDRIVMALEDQAPGHPGPARPASQTEEPEALRSALRRAQAAGQVGKAFELRDALTRHLRGESLHELDRGLALWMLNLVERRVRSRTADPQVAGWVARALDSLGEMPEAEPLRQSLPALRRQAGLCIRCGGPVPAAGRSGEGVCPGCRPGVADEPAGRAPRQRPSSTREQP